MRGGERDRKIGRKRDGGKEREKTKGGRGREGVRERDKLGFC